MKRFLSLLALGLLLSSKFSLLTVEATGTYSGPTESNAFADAVIYKAKSGVTYEKTTDASDAGSMDVLLGEKEDDMLYMGSKEKFEGFAIEVASAARDGKYEVEYWDGKDWTTLVAEKSADLKNEGSTGVLTEDWTRPSDWEKRSVNMNVAEDGSTDKSSESLYFVRLHITQAYNTGAYTDQIGLTKYNVVFSLENELGTEITVDKSYVSFSSSTGDTEVYSVKAMGSNRYGFALYIPSATTYTYTINVPGYVEKSASVKLKESETLIEESLLYAQVLYALSPEDGSSVGISSAKVGSTSCTVENRLAYCPVSAANDSTEATVYATGYAPATVTLYNRSKDSDAQAKNSFAMNYAYIATVEDQNAVKVTNAEVKMGSTYTIVCKNLGEGRYGCIVPETESSMIRINGIGTELSTKFSTTRSSISDAQVSQTFTLGGSTTNTTKAVDLDVESMEWQEDGGFIYTVENEGNLDVDEDESVYVAIYVDGSREYYQSFKNTSSSSFLNAGKSQSFNLGDDFLDDDEDSYKVKVCVDYTDNVDEDDEDNNCYEKTLSQEDDDDGVDLQVKDLYMDDGDLMIKVINSGDDDVDDNKTVKITVYVDGDLEYSISVDSNDKEADFFESDESSLINAGDDVFDGHGNAYDVRVCVDTTNNVSESNESNNCRTEDEGDLERDTNDSCSDFVDINNHWAEDYICDLFEEDIVEGYSSRYFKPNNDITRAEFLKIVLLGAGKDPYGISSGDNYSDVSTRHWAYDYITYATYKGYVEGYRDGTFRPDSPISRAEALTILMRIAGEEGYDFDSNDINFKDVYRDDWFAEAVVWADDEDIVEGYGDDTFRPGNDITRAEAVKIVDVAMEEVFN